MKNESNNEESDETIERILRIGELRANVEKAAGSPIREGGSGELSLEAQERFWQNIHDLETAPLIKRAEALEQRHGFNPRPLDSLPDEESLHEALWRLIGKLAEMSLFLSRTDHLSDRELYQLLLEEVLQQEDTVMPEGSQWQTHLDLSEYPVAGLPEPGDVYLKYYADSTEREEWADDFPGRGFPPPAEPPFDRDRFLPAPDR